MLIFLLHGSLDVFEPSTRAYVRLLILVMVLTVDVELIVLLVVVVVLLVAVLMVVVLVVLVVLMAAWEAVLVCKGVCLVAASRRRLSTTPLILCFCRCGASAWRAVDHASEACAVAGGDIFFRWNLRAPDHSFRRRTFRPVLAVGSGVRFEMKCG